jgi:AraC-like DNA-binding protein
LIISHNFFDVIILLGAVQGFIISTLLFFNREKVYAHRFLASLMTLISLACLNIYLFESLHFPSIYWTLFSALIPLIIAFPMGPIIYFYVQAVSNPEFRLSQKDRFHFYPVALDLIPNGVAFVFIGGLLTGVFQRADEAEWGRFIDLYNKYIDLPRWLSISVYVGFAWRGIRRPTKTRRSLKWPVQFVIVFALFQLVWLIYLIPYITPSLSQGLLRLVGWYPLYVPLAIIVYWLGINGLLVRHSEIKSRELKAPKLNMETVTAVTGILKSLMEKDKLFLDPDLDLSIVVQRSGTPQKVLSSVLNQFTGKSFNEFVNEYRVEEVKRRLFEPSMKHLTITGIAFECGFNSQATFQRAFKQATGLTPKEYVARQTEQNRPKSAQI